MDKNIAAILRNDTKTVVVKFAVEKDTLYTYVTDLTLKAGDLALVHGYNGKLAVVTVVEAHDELMIEPNSDMRFAWIAGKVDLTQYEANVERNQTIEKTISESYKARMRQSFSEAIMAQLPAETSDAIKSLL